MSNPNNTFSKGLGKLIYETKPYSLGCFVIYLSIIMFTITGMGIGIIFVPVFLPLGGDAIFIAFSLSFSIICTLLLYYCTRTYLRFYENGLVEKKWFKRVVMYDQSTCTWAEEICTREWIINRTNVIVKIRSYKVYTFSIFPDEEVGGGEIIITFDSANQDTGIKKLKAVLEQIATNNTKFVNHDNRKVKKSIYVL